MSASTAWGTLFDLWQKREACKEPRIRPMWDARFKQLVDSYYHALDDECRAQTGRVEPWWGRPDLKAAWNEPDPTSKSFRADHSARRMVRARF